MDTPLWTLTGWDMLTIVVGWCVAAVLWGMGKGFRNDLVKADATFDTVVRTAVATFPHSYIWVRRGPLFFLDEIAVTIITGRPTEDFVESADWLHYVWNPTLKKFEKVEK